MATRARGGELFVVVIKHYLSVFQAVPLSQSVKELVGHTLVPLLEMYETEDNK